MADKKQLGIFLASQGFYVVETFATKTKNLFYIPLQYESQKTEDPVNYLPVKESTAQLLEQALQKNKITLSTVNLSLPSRDIIFRSFIIPWMQSHEVKNVVTFEATRYVPFSLEDLVYCFHAMPITENGIRRLRIIFVAIKREILTHYTQILAEAKLQVDIVEPGTLSLLRSLTFKKILPMDQAVALIEATPFAGKITVVDQGIPQFVREFQMNLPVTGYGQELVDENDPWKHLIARLANEITISLDYVSRNNSQQVKQILLLTNTHTTQLATKLEQEIELPILPIDIPTVLENPNGIEIGFLNAYGINLTENVPSTVNFYLGLVNSQKPSVAKTLNTKVNIPRSTLVTAIICTIILAGMFFLSRQLVAHSAASISQLTQEISEFDNTSMEDLKTKSHELSDKLQGLKDIRIKSDVIKLLSLLSGALTQGTWLDNLEISYSDTSNKSENDNSPTRNITLNLHGHSYSANRDEQLRLVNSFVKNLKENKEFANFFDNIELENVTTESISNYEATSFSVKCQ